MYHLRAPDMPRGTFCIYYIYICRTDFMFWKCGDVCGSMYSINSFQIEKMVFGLPDIGPEAGNGVNNLCLRHWKVGCLN